MELLTIIVNFKTYESAVGQKAVDLAKIHEKVAQDLGVSIGVAVQPVDIFRVAQAVSIPVYAQHIDGVGYGSQTGWILPETVKEAGAVGTILNHAEHQLSPEALEKAIQRAKEVSLETVVCANTADAAAQILNLNPDLIAVEPPELIGGDVSVSKANPDIIKDSVAKVGEGKLLVGAGVKNQEDVRIGIQLGASGVLLASGVTKADDPEAVLRDLAAGLAG